MEVLLLILKIAGICLLLLLGLFLFLILSMIFIPVRYRIRGRGQTPDNVETDAVFSWFFHIIHSRVYYDAGGIKIRIRIFGIPISLEKKEKKQKKRKRKKRKKEKSAKNKSENTKETERENREETSNTDSKGTLSIPVNEEAKTEDTKRNIGAEDLENAKKNTETEDKKNAGFGKRILKRKFSIREKIKSVQRKILHWKEQLGNIKSIILEETNKNALRFLFQEFKFLMKHYTPRKVSGELMFGMEDPAVTGQVLGIISMFPFWYRYKISVTPDFTAECFYAKGNFKMKGRMRSIHLLASGIRFIKNKDIRKLIKQIRR